MTRGYALQRYMLACAGRGAYPIKFNGSLFTVDTYGRPGPAGGLDADFRRWGGPYWFQNTRLAYWPMLAAGDLDLMKLSEIMADKAIVDAGLKAQSVDSGLPVVFGRTDVKYAKCSDEHGVVEDPQGVLKVNDKLRLVPGHCDPTCNVHDWYVGVRNGKVETLWPVSARGKAY